jgi:hypothetical protein
MAGASTFEPETAQNLDPESRSVSVFTPDGTLTHLENSAALNGSDVVPGFVLKLMDLFGELDRHR